MEHVCNNVSCNLVTTNRLYCSRACSNSAQPKRVARLPKVKLCIECATNPLPKNAKKFCGKQCQALHQHASVEKTAGWLNGTISATKSAGKGKCGLASWARTYLLIEAKYACTKCGWDTPHALTGKPPLEIDHIDGNRCNNSRDNLVVLCPNCHSLTLTYRRYNYKNVQILKEVHKDFK